MKIGDREVNLEPIEIEMIRLIHPLFLGLSFKKAAEILHWHPATVSKAWKYIVSKYPKLEETREKWDNPYNITRDKVRNATAVSDMSQLGTDGKIGSLYPAKGDDGEESRFCRDVKMVF